ncbi:hypothetical protein RUND412_007799 [Rhizina undulata]
MVNKAEFPCKDVLRVIPEFTGGIEALSAKRWWSILVLELDYDDDAKWADSSPEVSDLRSLRPASLRNVMSLKKLFFVKFLVATLSALDINRELDLLKQARKESIENYYGRTRRLLNHICEDSEIDGNLRTLPKAE